MKKLLFVLPVVALLLLAQTGGNIQWTQIKSTDRHGSAGMGQSSDGTGTSGNLPKYDSSGSLTDGGVAVSGLLTLGSLSGTSPIVYNSGTGAISCPTCGTGTGSVSSIATAGPLSGGTITTTGTLACPTCSVTIATGVSSLGTSSISSGACDTVVTGTATNVRSGIAYTDLVIDGTDNTKVTSSAHPFASALQYGYIVITGGTGFTTGTYRILSVSGSTAVLSSAVGTVSSTGGIGTLAGDNIQADFNVDPTSTTGYQASTSGMLTIIKYPGTDSVNFKVCNNTGAAITPGAINLNWRVAR